MQIPDDPAERLLLVEKLALRILPATSHTWLHKPNEACAEGMTPARLAMSSALGCWLAMQLLVASRTRH